MRFLIRSFALLGSVVSIATGQTPALEHFTVMADGHPLAVWARRPAAPKGTILLIHGRTWSSLPDFDLQVPGEHKSVLEGLAARGYAAFALDLRGYGSTPRDKTGWNTPNRAATDVAEVLKWIAIKQPLQQRPALLGWSNGSLVVQLAAQQHPELLSALILYGYPLDPDERFAPDSGERKPDRDPTSREGAKSDFIAPNAISRAAIEAYATQAVKADPILSDWYHLTEFNALDPRRVKTPTMVLQGELDPGLSPAALSRLYNRLGSTERRRVILMGGDHAALLENTRPTFIDAVVGFLERTPVH